MHLRPFFSLLLAGTMVLLVNASASAQVDTTPTTQSGYLELTFSDGTGSTSCLTASDDNIVWGTAYIDLSSGSICSDSADADDDNIVWGTALSSDDDNIVWGTALAFDDNIVWGTALAFDDNIVWGTAAFDDNIVWGTSVSLEF